MIWLFIKTLVNVQRVRFITNRSQIYDYLNVDMWRKLINECARLDRVTIQLVYHRSFIREAHDMEQHLRRIRPEMIFRIKCT